MNSKAWFGLALAALVVVGVLGWFAVHPKHCVDRTGYGGGQVCRR